LLFGKNVIKGVGENVIKGVGENVIKGVMENVIKGVGENVLRKYKPLAASLYPAQTQIVFRHTFIKFVAKIGKSNNSVFSMS